MPIALGLIVILGAMVLALLVAYLISSYRHERERSFVIRNQKRWQRMIVQSLTGALKLQDIELTRRERPYFRDLIVDAVFHHELDSLLNLDIERQSFAQLKQDPSIRDKTRTLYVKLGFLADDLRELRNRRWWHRVKALERLEDTGITEGEDEILARLTDKRPEVRFTALRNLALSGTDKFHARVAEIFSTASTWSYLYLVNLLYNSDLPIEVLKPLATSRNQFERKAAATLLGRSMEKEAISLLAKLAEDKVAEVRREAVTALARTGSAAALPIFWRKLKDANPQVRAAIARGIGDLGHVIHLQKLADDDEFEVRFQAFASLKKLGVLGTETIKNYRGKYKELAEEFLAEVEHA